MKRLYERDEIQALADSIKNKANTTSKYTILGLKNLVDNLKVIFTTEEKTVSPTESKQEITPTSADGLSKVTINPISSTYIGSAIAKNPTPTVSGATVTIPSGYYSEETSKSVATTTQATPGITVSETGLITASATQSAGYISAGTKSNTKQLDVQAAKTITPSTSSQTAVAKGVYTTGAVTVNPIPVSAITNSIINGSSNVAETGESIDTFTVTVSVPAGYHEEQTLTKSFENILPELESDATNDMILNGYEAYADDGTKLSGTMTNNGSVSQTLTGTTTSYTIPKGYHDGTGTVSHSTVNIPDPSITVNASGLITASGSWTAGFTTDTSYSNTKQLTTKAATTIAPTESVQTAIASGTYATGDIKIGAISTTYVGSGVTKRTSTDVTASGATVTVPAGYYASQATKSVTSGSAGTPSATKGTVSNHQISITPTVTNTTGYITGGTKNGTAVTVSASELVSGSETKTENGSYDVTNLATLVVNIPIQKYYTGSSTPASSLGSNGDLYLKV